MTTPLSICLVTTFYPPYHFGGDAVFVHRLAGALAGRGHAVDVVHSVDAYRLTARQPRPGFAEVPGVRRLPLETAMPQLASLAAHQLGSPAPMPPGCARSSRPVATTSFISTTSRWSAAPGCSVSATR